MMEYLKKLGVEHIRVIDNKVRVIYQPNLSQAQRRKISRLIKKHDEAIRDEWENRSYPTTCAYNSLHIHQLDRISDDYIKSVVLANAAIAKAKGVPV